MSNISNINHTSIKHKDKIRLCFDHLTEVELPTSGDEFLKLMNLFDALEKGELTPEVFDIFKSISNAQNCWRKIKETLICAELRGRVKL